MVGSVRAIGLSARLLRHTVTSSSLQWRILERQWHRQLSLQTFRPQLPRTSQHLRSPCRHASTTNATAEAAKKTAEETAQNAKMAARNTANTARKTAEDTAKTAKKATVNTAKATASGGSRLVAYIYGTSLVLLLSFGYLYITDTRASIHQYVVVPLLRLIHQDPEDAHHRGIRYIKALYDFNLHPRERGNLDQELGDLKIEVFGHVLDNPIGTSAGIDKNAEIPDALLALGPAIVEVGGATPLPQEGNPKPRVFRIPSQNALINRYGLNSDGAEHVAMELRERVRAFAYGHGLGLGSESERIILDGEAQVPPGSLIPGKLLAVQVAKNKTTPDNDISAVANDYVFCVEHLAKYADILVVNVSSPNTPGLRDLQATKPLTAILSAVVDAAKSVDRKTKPAVMVKVSPDEDSDNQIEGICSAVWASGVDGVIVGNTTKRRPDPFPKGYIMPENETRLLAEMGGYSGPQMFERTLNLVKKYRSMLDQGPPEGAPEPPSSKKFPAQAPPVAERHSLPSSKLELDPVNESIQRDTDRLKPLTPEAESNSKQPLIQLPDRQLSEGVEERAKSIAEAAKTDSSVSTSSPSTPPQLFESQASSAREAAEGALQKIVSTDQAEKSSPAQEPQQKVIFATGGITNGEQCLQILNAGASVCQVYTAMMYGGVGTITRMKSEMREAIKQGSKKS